MQRQSEDLMRRKKKKKFQKEDHIYTPPPIRLRVHNQQQLEVKISQEEEGFRKATPFRRYPTPRYQTFFNGLCYSCNNFGHKDVNCRAKSRNRNNYEVYTRNSYPRRPNEMK
jgi:hypothetical protein